MMQVAMLFSMRHVSLADLPCPIARTLDVVGEWWTLLIVRDALHGARRFEEFKGTGIADNVLSARLQKLTDAGILERRLYQNRPDRYEYVLTPKGQALAPVVAALRQWGRGWTSGEDPSDVLHAECGHDAELGFFCAHCGRRLEKNEVSVSART